MKKINLFMIIALVLMMSPMVSNGKEVEKQEQKGTDGEDIKITTTSVKVDDEDESNTEDLNDDNSQDQEDNTSDDIDDDSIDDDSATSTNATSTQRRITEREREVIKNSEERRNQVAKAVQELVKSAERVGGIGEQVRVIAQEQNKIQEEAENAIKEAAQRGGFLKFVIGPDYQKLKEVENKSLEYVNKLDELKQTKEQVTVADVKNAIDAQIKVLEEAKTSLDSEVENQKKGFSLFGWLNRLFVK